MIGHIRHNLSPRSALILSCSGGFILGTWPYSTRLSLSKIVQCIRDNIHRKGTRTMDYAFDVDKFCLPLCRGWIGWCICGLLLDKDMGKLFTFWIRKTYTPHDDNTMMQYVSHVPMMATSFHVTRNRRIKFARHIALTWPVSDNGSNRNNALGINVVPCTSISSCSPHPFLFPLSLYG